MPIWYPGPESNRHDGMTRRGILRTSSDRGQFERDQRSTPGGLGDGSSASRTVATQVKYFRVMSSITAPASRSAPARYLPAGVTLSRNPVALRIAARLLSCGLPRLDSVR